MRTSFGDLNGGANGAAFQGGKIVAVGVQTTSNERWSELAFHERNSKGCVGILSKTVPADLAYPQNNTDLNGASRPSASRTFLPSGKIDKPVRS